jgi:hypothetical protein
MRARLEPMKKVAKTMCSQAAHVELVRGKKPIAPQGSAVSISSPNQIETSNQEPPQIRF